jgi:hypothetical protein
LQYASKLVESAVADKIQQHLSLHNLFPSMQSAYRQHHSTETALLRVKHDLLMAMDKQQVTFLIMLDMSATFDSIKHEIILSILKLILGYLM